MGKRKNNNNNPQQPQNQQNEDNGGEAKEVQKNGGGGDSKKGGNKSDGSIVLKVEMHCDGCATKVLKVAHAFKGVEDAKADIESKKLVVTGKVDPIQIRDFLQQKTKKKVDLISPIPKKEDPNNAKNKDQNNNKPNDGKPEAENKKPKEAPVTTAVIKVAFHCLGCLEKIHKIVIKTKGVHEMNLDQQKETVTVKGTMDAKALTETLKDKLKKPVEIVPPKKEKDGDKESGGGDGDKSGGGGGKSGGGGGGGKKKKGGGGGQENAGGNGGEVAVAKMEYMVPPGYGFGPGTVTGYGYTGMGQGPPVPGYDYGFGYQVSGYPVHMKFNDENPNACSVM